jgi:hypothetical protein
MEVENNIENDNKNLANTPKTKIKTKEMSTRKKANQSGASKRYDSLDNSEVDSLLHEIKRHILRLKLARTEQAHEDDLETFTLDSSLPLTLIPRVPNPYKDEKVMMLQMVKHIPGSDSCIQFIITPRGTMNSLRLSTKVY